jgi:hypothetical protein
MPADAAPARHRRRRSAKLAISTGRKRPDAFYARVAEIYGDLAKETDAPATVMAEANDVPVSTVHRWVKEARRRGLLGAGRRGAVG